MLLQRLATGATGVNKRDTGEGQRQAYSGQRGTRTRMRSIYTTLVYVHREFCTLSKIKPSARMRSEGYFVCLSVCLCVCLLPL